MKANMNTGEEIRIPLTETEEILKQKKGSPLPGIFFCILTLIGASFFLYYVLQLNMLPQNFLILLIVLFGLIALLFLLMGLNSRKAARTVIAGLLTVVITGGLIYGGVVLAKITGTMNKITNPDLIEEVEMGLYVRAGDPAQSIGDAASYRIGIMETVDREQANEAVRLLQKETGREMQIVSYESPIGLISALLEWQVDAILVNSGYVSMASSLESFSGLLSQVRLLKTYTLENVIETKAAEETQEPAPTAAPEETRPEDETFVSDGNTFAIYISGIDDRRGMVARSLSDVNIIAVINPTTRNILLVNTPRDYYVQTPVSGGAKDKLTHAGLYGVDVSKKTLENLYGMEIDYIFRVDFYGFINIVDSLGGVDVYSEYEFDSGDCHFEKGYNHVTGYQALNFARQRHAFSEGDRQRGKNQMELIKAIIKKALSSEILSRYDALLDAVAGSFETTVPYDLIAKLVRMQISKGGSWNILSYSVNGEDEEEGSFTFPAKNYVMIPNMETVEKAKQLIWDVWRKTEVTIE